MSAIAAAVMTSGLTVLLSEERALDCTQRATAAAKVIPRTDAMTT